MHRDDFVVPHSCEAEQSILGALMLDNDAIDRVDGLGREHFYRADHASIYGVICELIVAAQPADVVTVYERFAAKGHAEQIGGLSYLQSLVNTTPSSANIRRYAETVRDKAIKRQLLALTADVPQMVIGSDAARIVVDRVQTKLESLAQERVKSEPVKASDDLSAYIDDLQEAAEGKIRSIPTGFVDLDDKLGGGLNGGELIVVAGRPSMGKAQPLDATVLRADGKWARMGNISVGDALASIDGASSVVTGVFPQGNKPIYRVKFNDGRSTEACGEHLWPVRSSKWDGVKVLSTDEVFARMKKVRYRGRMWVDSVSGHFGSSADFPIDPWLMGALLGDGDFTGSTPRFSKGAAEIIERVRNSLPEGLALVHAGGVNYRISQHRDARRVSGNEISNAIKELGLSGCDSLTKFIPQCYLEADRDTRLALLRGILDTDGWVEKTGSVQFSTSSKQMSDGVVVLARSLGYWVTVREKYPKYTYKGEKLSGATAYVSTIAGAHTSELFLFSEKAVRCFDSDERGRIRFESIEYSRDEECQCISVSHPSRLYVTDNYIVTHNTALAMSVARNVSYDRSALVLSMEMPRSQLHQRNVAALGRIHMQRLRQPDRMTDADWQGFTAAAAKLSDMNLYLDDQPALTLLEIRSKARLVKRKHGLDLLIVDYLGLMTGGPSENRNQEVGSYSRGLKALAKELDIPIIALAQLNRGLESRANRRPQMSDLRDSGEIEQDADTIMFLYRDEVYDPNSQAKGICEVIIAKQRQGETGMVPLAYLGEYTAFEGLQRGYTVPVPKREPVKARGFD